MRRFDAVVIGAGSGGLTVLDELLGAGKRVAIVTTSRACEAMHTKVTAVT